MTTFQRDMTFPADRYEEWFDKARAYVDRLSLSLLSSAVMASSSPETTPTSGRKCCCGAFTAAVLPPHRTGKRIA